MIDFSKLSQNELIEQAEKYWKLLLKAKKDMDKSSNARCIAWTDCSRSKMTTLNAKLQRDAEYFEKLKSDLKLLINNI